VGGGSRSASIRSGLVLIRRPRRIGSDGAQGAREAIPESEKSRRGATFGAPGVGLEPTTFRLTAGRVYQLSYPGPALP
jgi:hypothetical protein